MAENDFDLVIIGSGPGGYVAAIRSAQLGMKTACVEVGELGGVCNNVGCIPTKAMLESAKHAHTVTELADFGVTVGEVKLDIGVAAKRSKKVADMGARGIAYLFKKNGVEWVKGWGQLAGGGKVVVALNDGGAERFLQAKNIIIATGSRAKDLPILRIDRDRVWSSDEAVFPKATPASLAIIGAGAVGMEFADVYNSFGTKVTIIEAMDRLLPVEDKDVSPVLEKAYKKRGIDVFTSARLEKADVSKSGVKLSVKLKDGKSNTIEAERVLVAVGRAPIINDIGLEAANVAVERGFIVTNEKLQTNVPGVFAIGDVTKPPLLAHKASHEGITVAETIAGSPHSIDYLNIPGVTYCHPEVASVGLTEDAAREKGFDIETGVFPWSANGRARGSGETDGFIKVIRDKRYSELVGAHIVGANASELIGQFVVGRHLETTVEEMTTAVYAHPTLSDAVPEAALAALGRAIHI
jgi:dihydrolipoamide dehydrogenase